MAFDLKRFRALPPLVCARLDVVPAPLGAPFGPCVCYVGRRFSRNGYGRLYCDRARAERQAHGYVYDRLVGPVPPGLVLDHLCRVRTCVAPWHLEPVTVRENTRRGQAILFQPQESYR